MDFQILEAASRAVQQQVTVQPVERALTPFAVGASPDNTRNRPSGGREQGQGGSPQDDGRRPASGYQGSLLAPETQGSLSGLAQAVSLTAMAVPGQAQRFSPTTERPLTQNEDPSAGPDEGEPQAQGVPEDGTAQVATPVPPTDRFRAATAYGSGGGATVSASLSDSLSEGGGTASASDHDGATAAAVAPAAGPDIAPGDSVVLIRRTQAVYDQAQAATGTGLFAQPADVLDLVA